MIIIISLIGLLVIILIIGRINLSFQFNKEVKELFSQAKSISGKSFSYKQLLDLPEPVQTYFKRVLKEGEPYISYARITHDGQFKPGLDKRWINIKGEQYATTEKPGFTPSPKPGVSSSTRKRGIGSACHASSAACCASRSEGTSHV